MSNSLDPENLGPDLDPNCLQRLSAEDTIGNMRIKVLMYLCGQGRIFYARFKCQI